ncbi:MAG: type IX secretion system membrane protein PorP/SprF [Bacteroidota bacterium]
MDSILFPLKRRIAQILKCSIVLSFMTFGLVQQTQAQESNPYVSYDVPFQNLLKFNRFLINPTFSAVRENKSYVNLFHRSQGADFTDNNQNYFLSYSGRINDRIGMGLSLYNQQEGIITNLGVMANYAHGVKLGQNTNLSFGVNIPYYVSNVDANRAIALEDDPVLNDATQTSVISIQPGMNLSLGKFDVGVFAQNLFDYNLKSGESLSEGNDKTFSGHLQYSHTFENGAGIFEDGRLMPLARARVEGGQNAIFGGGLILDLPKLGWLQGGYDQFYGLSAGTGFNLNRRLSFGYNFEKNTNSNLNNLGVTHEVSIAFSFVPNLTKNAIASDDEDEDEDGGVGQTLLADNSDAENKSSSKLKAKTRLRPTNKEDLYFWEEQMQKLQEQQADNYAVINELIYRMDSIEEHRERDFERRFELVMRMVKRQTGNKLPRVEQAAQELYLAQTIDLDSLEKAYAKTDLASNTPKRKPARKTSKKADKKGKNTYKPVEKYMDLEGIGQGHYIVANVFSNEAYLKRFMQKLKDQGLNAEYFKNPENGLNYVYLAKFQQNEDAYAAFESQMKGKYKEELWIMHIDNPRYSGWAETSYSDAN